MLSSVYLVLCTATFTCMPVIQFETLETCQNVARIARVPDVVDDADTGSYQCFLVTKREDDNERKADR